jgi:hypothetical protein
MWEGRGSGADSASILPGRLILRESGTIFRLNWELFAYEAVSIEVE